MTKMCSPERAKVLEENLSMFIQKHLPGVKLSDLDEIGRSYIISILEELGSVDSTDEVFDVEQFIEMMEAYLPGFGLLDSVTVSEWMFDLSTHLVDCNATNTIATKDAQKSTSKSDVKEVVMQNGHDAGHKHVRGHHRKTPKKDNNPFKDIFDRQLSLPETMVTDPPDVRKRTKSQSSDVKSKVLSTFPQTHTDDRQRTQSTSSSTSDITSSTFDEDYISDEEADEAIMMLVEMFPDTCTMEINHCMGVVNGDTEKAAQLILSRQECGQSITKKAAKTKGNAPGSKMAACNILNDTSVKRCIIDKYAYIDVDADKKHYKPQMPKSQDKKMIRYLDGKIVSTRGERFTEIKKDDDENMKKTFVNLKPAKQYRFH